MHGRPGPNDTPYDLRDEVLAEKGDGEPQFLIITKENRVLRHQPNDPEPRSGIQYDIESGRLGIEKDDVARILRLGEAFWDIEERDSVTLTRVERKAAYDKKGDHMHNSGLYVVVEYDYARFPGPHNSHSTEQRFSMDDFYSQVTSGDRHALKCISNHDDKSFDDIRFLRRREHSDPTALPP